MPRINLYLALALALTAAAWTASAVAYPRLPATIPTHWNAQSKVDGYGPRALTLVPAPLVMVGMIGFFLVIPAIVPKDSAGKSIRPVCMVVMAIVVGVFAFLHGVILLATWQHVTKSLHPVDIGRATFATMFLAIALAGGVLGKVGEVGRNPYAGIRVPWTLASDRVWADTHKLAAPTFVVGGALAFLIAVAGFSLAVSFAVIIVTLAVPVLYSFVHYKKLEGQGAL